MPDKFLFVMAGGGTGGHVIPLLAVARELRSRGDDCVFVGTRRGAEARLVPVEGFPLEMIHAGGLQGVGLGQKIVATFELVIETWNQFRKMGSRRPSAVFSLGGYVAGPPVLGALLRGVPVVVMEPNAVPGLTNRWIARYVRSALINFPETARFFPNGRTEVTGLPVREEFFHIPARESAQPFTILITGGSQGALTLNRAARDAWPKLRELGDAIYIIHQTGPLHFEEFRTAFEASGVNGEMMPFIVDMPAAFARADLVICRSGAGAVSELAAAGKASVLIPYPYAADDHQRHNAEEFRNAGAALLVGNAEWTGGKMLEIIRQLSCNPEGLRTMGERARSLAHRGAAGRAADILEGVARESR
jgi:UDP-N-acetylglucosamine--N-acetylmuramyl-(pentapeptide) pyrophosphoryl-undecaprenol N-acetylglucosamine transferase